MTGWYASALGVAVLGAVLWWYVGTPAPTAPASVFTDAGGRFTFAVPHGYTVHGAEGLVRVEDEAGAGIQILISEIDEDIPVMTPERIRADIPDLTITDTEPVEIGTDRMGLAFKSDNEAFDGASREVWFVYHGYLYQISTYERLDPTLKQLFSTWHFI